MTLREQEKQQQQKQRQIVQNSEQRKPSSQESLKPQDDLKQQHDIIASLPPHLRPFAALQYYERYTPRDQAVWRFLLHQLRENLTRSAESTYLEGLEKTGINPDYIPRIEEMNACLNKLGWRAVVVDGFVPPAIFMEFQAHRVLAIAVDMRSIEHMLYTPAPDIVHESAGHAPFIIDVDYAEFLQRFGELGMRAVASKGDLNVYEAIRSLSILKENPRSTSTQINASERALQEAIDANYPPSEAALLSRLHWWTVEYGLVGAPDDYRIFGAGLLSSLGESMNCLDDDKVTKLPLTVDAVNIEYDITREQPQLFVTRNCRHLSQVLEEFGRQMCVNQGGADSVWQAIDAQTINTAVTNAGVEISGLFTEVLTDAVGNITYLKTTGPTQLAYQQTELPGHGTQAHEAGFGCPIGRLQTMERCLSSYTVDELKQHGISQDSWVQLDFLSGVRVSGRLTQLLRRDQKNLVFTFEECTVTGIDGEVLFDPSWGVFDMAVGAEVVSVYGGSADKDTFPMFHSASALQGTADADPEPGSYYEGLQRLFSFYENIRNFREAFPVDGGRQRVEEWILRLQSCDRGEWLMVFEVLELALMYEVDDELCQVLIDRLVQMECQGCDNQKRLIQYGLKRLRTQFSDSA
ncbi:aromatic amino acid hydroxylase [Pseudomaricurvus sp.]|uniref:aromatic amino acid hydroxylase n=1 Tax=Pseudomaricurvus sp. TaxID=2004510 RepID=UPI003F6B87D7